MEFKMWVERMSMEKWEILKNGEKIEKVWSEKWRGSKVWLWRFQREKEKVRERKGQSEEMKRGWKEGGLESKPLTMGAAGTMVPQWCLPP